MKIKHVETMTLDIPFYADHVTRAMQRAQTHNERVELCRIETDNGIVGYGDNSVHNPDSLIGQNPFVIMNDDSIGFGAQLAAMDIAGKAAGAPVHALLGDKVRDRCPISWWDIDMPPEDWVAEAKESLKRGYTTFKMKARPWRDIIEQIETVEKVVPLDYKFDIDFNGFLLTQAKAEIILQQLDPHPNVGMYESPFYLQEDLTGARILRERVCKPIVEHFREEVLHAHCSDGFVIGGGATVTRHHAALAAAFNKPFWLQLVGTGITTAFAVHLGSVLSHAQLPYITCFELWEHNLLKGGLEVIDGFIDVPDAPGLGVEVDEKAIKKYQVDPTTLPPTALYRQNKRILRINWPGVEKKQRVWEFTDEGNYQLAFYQGNIPGFERGVNLEVIEDDNSSGFRKQHEKLVARGL